MKKVYLLIVVAFSFLSFNSIFAQVQKIKPIPKVKIDIPQIIEFKIEPQIGLVGDSIKLSWKVKPGEGGSPIKQIVLMAEGSIPIDLGTDLEGEHQGTLLEAGRKLLRLAVKNEAGLTATKDIYVEVFSLEEIRDKISLEEISTRPSPVLGDKTPFTFHVKINNNSGVQIRTLQIRILQTDDPSGRTGTVIADKTDLLLVPGVNIYDLNASGFDSTYGRSLFLILLYGKEVPRRELNKFLLNLIIRSVPSYEVKYEKLI